MRWDIRERYSFKEYLFKYGFQQKKENEDSFKSKEVAKREVSLDACASYLLRVFGPSSKRGSKNLDPKATKEYK